MRLRPSLTGIVPPLRTVFVSDLHLGSRNCHADALAGFLESFACERIYLVGDIVDLWWLAKRRASWGRQHARVFEALRAHAADGAELVYIPGNHDRPMREFAGLALPGMTLRRRAIHTLADGRRFLVTHGDEHDAGTELGALSHWLGDKLYEAILAGNRLTRAARNRLGLRYWSLADFLKRRSGTAEKYIERYVALATGAARARGLDGVVCGHIHRPALTSVDGIVYANDGDWVESFTAITEAHDGTLELLRWVDRAETVATLPPRLVLRAQEPVSVRRAA